MERFEDLSQFRYLSDHRGLRSSWLVSFYLSPMKSFSSDVFGGTPGKLLLACGLFRSDFSRLTYGRAAIRFFGKMLSDLTYTSDTYCVYSIPSDGALHDYVADTRVIKRDQPALLLSNSRTVTNNHSHPLSHYHRKTPIQFKHSISHTLRATQSLG